MPSESAEQEPQAKNPIESATSFAELSDAIRKEGAIQGSRVRAYKPEELEKIIGEVRSGIRPLRGLTRTNGLRRKVGELLRAESSTEFDPKI